MRRAIQCRSRDEWLARRRVGASDVARVVLPEGKGGDQWRVWRRLTSPPVRDEELRPGDARLRGRVFEPIVLYLYRVGYDTGRGREVRPERPFRLWYGPDEWSSASLDGVTRDSRLGIGAVEGKTDAHVGQYGDPTVIERWEAGAEDIVRPDYALQAYAQIHVVGLAFVDLAVLFPRYELRVYRFLRDPVVEEALTDTIGPWWDQYVVPREPPALSASDSCRQWFADRFAGAKGKRQATEDEATVAREVAGLKAERARLKGEIDLRSNALLAAMGDAKTLELPDRGGKVVAVRSLGRDRLNTGRLAADHPDIRLEEYLERGDPFAYLRLYGVKPPEEG